MQKYRNHYNSEHDKENEGKRKAKKKADILRPHTTLQFFFSDSEMLRALLPFSPIRLVGNSSRMWVDLFIYSISFNVRVGLIQGI
jgi:hypothetical protein